MQNIIIITGAAGTGKTWLARYIQKSDTVYNYQIEEEHTMEAIIRDTENATETDALIFTTQSPAKHFKGKGAWIISTTY